MPYKPVQSSCGLHMNMFSSLKVFLYLFTLSSSLALVSAADQSCVTPSQQNGKCVFQNNCPAYKKAFDEHFASNIEYFRKLKCSFEGSFPKICCPDDKSYRITKIKKPTKKRQRNKKVEVQIHNRFGEEEVLPGKDSCGQQTYGNRIVDGEITEIDEFPWMALLFYKKKLERRRYNFGCGGALIQKKYVLTAAHCVTGYAFDQLEGLEKIRLGEYNVETDEDCVIEGEFEDCAPAPIDRLPERIMIHPQYSATNKDQGHDIALIRLDNYVEFTDFIQPICLPDNDIFPRFSIKDTKLLFVAGWGRNGSGVNSPVKMKLKVPIIEHTRCKRTYTRFNIDLIDSQICAGGERGKDSCKGDSGGPLMTVDPATGHWISTGIVSIGPNVCGSSGIPGIYTNVKDYIAWIKTTIEP